MGIKILIVDDDSTTVDILSRVLSLEGFDVEGCSNADVALERLSTETYDVLLTDWVMPRTSGRDLIRAAQAHAPKTHCLVMTGHDEALVSRATNAAWIPKPLDIEVLIEKIKAGLPS